jgi:hypothetical protein
VAQDRAVDEERHPGRPQEADVPRDAPHTDLSTRAERLPVGHPSSPYLDDGSRKAPPLDLNEYEWPLPDESAEPESGTDDRARVNPDGSWEWRGRRLTPEQNRIADDAHAKCREAEGRDADGNYGDHGLTPAMRRIEAQLDHGHLVEDTEKYAIKDPDRFKQKLAKLIVDEPGSNPSEITARIHDRIRYTCVFESEEYASGVSNLSRALYEAGFELYERKNTWVDETKSYKGINSSWMDPQSSQLFEVQMHTPASWEAKQESHPTYEILEDPTSTPEQRAAALKEQDRIFAKVPIPPNVKDVRPYRREGW